ncbi:hypothetical protein WN55_07940 [Dufourea novaeangliae]|uniref:Uncharacterized protein n=1 Tax=Dufourea novaeangliae TaxID=178035 RepID=A0A154PSL9_DUFNO|nr:hypothetical protein WN55_07940 [Dufourea novaeangliae]
MSMCTCSHLPDGTLKHPGGAETCLDIFERWHCTQARAQVRQSALTDGQTYRSVTSLTVALTPGCARRCTESHAFRLKSLVTNGRTVRVDTS